MHDMKLMEIDDLQYPEEEPDPRPSRSRKAGRNKRILKKSGEHRWQLRTFLDNNSKPIGRNLGLAYNAADSIQDKLTVIKYAISIFWKRAFFIKPQSSDKLEVPPHISLDSWNEISFILFQDSTDQEKLHIAEIMSHLWSEVISSQRKSFQNAKIYLFGEKQLKAWQQKYSILCNKNGTLLSKPIKKEELLLFTQPTLLPQTLESEYAHADKPIRKAQAVIRAIQYFYREANSRLKDVNIRFIHTAPASKAELIKWVNRLDDLYNKYSNNANIQREFIDAALLCWSQLEKTTTRSSAIQSDKKENKNTENPLSLKPLIISQLQKWRQRKEEMPNNCQSHCCIIL